MRKGNHNIREMQEDFDDGNEFEIKTLCPFDKKDHDRKTKALESLFMLQYDRVGKGYNATYNYPSVERTHEIVEDNAEYIIRCLKNNGIRFRLEIKL